MTMMHTYIEPYRLGKKHSRNEGVLVRPQFYPLGLSDVHGLHMSHAGMIHLHTRPFRLSRRADRRQQTPTDANRRCPKHTSCHLEEGAQTTEPHSPDTSQQHFLSLAILFQYSEHGVMCTISIRYGLLHNYIEKSVASFIGRNCNLLIFKNESTNLLSL